MQPFCRRPAQSVARERRLQVARQNFEAEGRLDRRVFASCRGRNAGPTQHRRHHRQRSQSARLAGLRLHRGASAAQGEARGRRAEVQARVRRLPDVWPEPHRAAHRSLARGQRRRAQSQTQESRCRLAAAGPPRPRLRVRGHRESRPRRLREEPRLRFRRGSQHFTPTPLSCPTAPPVPATAPGLVELRSELDVRRKQPGAPRTVFGQPLQRGEPVTALAVGHAQKKRSP